ncbi:BlaI/MecI/CopY family transcriptional regulator [Aliikangiella maris]|uniref:BlaI/MecI/CopY family transcriptional regulator n=2 Tax=Aliikangiella maris TaxID=3162458 RepID=A0ABV2BV38_9GAMM
MNKISDSEKVIMDILWQSSPLTALEIIDKIDAELNWQDKTIKTLINRLLKKEAIGFKKQGRIYHYFPVLQQDAYIQSATTGFLQRVFGGSVTNLVAAFAKHEQLSDKDIQELKALLKKLEK